MNQKTEFRRQRPEGRGQKICILFSVFCILFSSVGCEAFVRKFTRKSKKSDQPVEMVLTPEEYKGPDMSKEDLYRQYFMYWNSWQEELINALSQKASLKKKVDCAQQALKNLVNMKMLLIPDAQKNVDIYINKLNDLLGYLQSDTYGARDDRNCQAARIIKSNIQRNLIYPKIKNYLK